MKLTQKSEFGKNVITLISGTALAQALTLLLSPVISRIYSPQDLGFFGVFMSIVSGIAVIACGRFELTILLPKDEQEADNNRKIALLFCISISLITSLVMLGLLYVGVLDSYLYLLAVMMVYFLGIYQINTNIALRSKDYKLIAKSRVANSIINMLLAIVLGLGGLFSFGLIAGAFAGQAFSNMIFPRVTTGLSFRFEALKKLKNNFVRYKDFLRINSIQALSDMFMINALFYLLPIYYNAAIIGLYALAIRILQAPMSLLGSSIAQVFYQQASHHHKQNISNSTLVRSTIKKAALVALPIPIILLLFGKHLFSLVFGGNWTQAGIMAGILAPWIYFDFIRATISQITLIINKQKELFKLSLMGNILIVLVIVISGSQQQNIENTFIILSTIMSIFSLFLIRWMYNIANKN
jgi:hypothetical protein